MFKMTWKHLLSEALSWSTCYILSVYLLLPCPLTAVSSPWVPWDIDSPQGVVQATGHKSTWPLPRKWKFCVGCTPTLQQRIIPGLDACVIHTEKCGHCKEDVICCGTIRNERGQIKIKTLIYWTQEHQASFKKIQKTVWVVKNSYGSTQTNSVKHFISPELLWMTARNNSCT